MEDAYGEAKLEYFNVFAKFMKTTFLTLHCIVSSHLPSDLSPHFIVTVIARI